MTTRFSAFWTITLNQKNVLLAMWYFGRPSDIQNMSRKTITKRCGLSLESILFEIKRKIIIVISIIIRRNTGRSSRWLLLTIINIAALLKYSLTLGCAVAHGYKTPFRAVFGSNLLVLRLHTWFKSYTYIS